MKLAIATIYTDNIKELAQITVENNKRKYCEKHGYDLKVKKVSPPFSSLVDLQGG